VPLHERRHLSELVSPRSCSPSITPCLSAGVLVWLAFHLPTIRSTGISMPTILLSSRSMCSAGASDTFQGSARLASCASVSRVTSSSIQSRSWMARGMPVTCTTA
jgi:hypothetical protein